MTLRVIFDVSSACPVTSAVVLKADVRLRCNICRDGPSSDISHRRRKRFRFSPITDIRYRHLGSLEFHIPTKPSYRTYYDPALRMPSTYLAMGNAVQGAVC